MSVTTLERDIAAKPPAPTEPPGPTEPPAPSEPPGHDAPATPEPEVEPETSTPPGTRSRRPMPRRDAGMSTAEYAVGTLAAVAFALLLIKVINSPEILDALTALVDRALNSAG
ncbi:DUF4244 domain-containing protein [Nonomuraea sp. NPDC050790]|uniref:DUF4244 domain-containing protein n=1 Tax=Nonomuraea sp. NPDC050790 TaxID=3364371 RepID=UPI00378D15E6